MEALLSTPMSRRSMLWGNVATTLRRIVPYIAVQLAIILPICVCVFLGLGGIEPPSGRGIGQSGSVSGPGWAAEILVSHALAIIGALSLSIGLAAAWSIRARTTSTSPDRASARS